VLLQLARREAARRRAAPAPGTPRPQRLARQGVARPSLPAMRQARAGSRPPRTGRIRRH
jgi:hypothetical protein